MTTSNPEPSHPRLYSPIAKVGCFLAIWILVSLLQLWNGGFDTEFTIHPDEPSHFITGVMAHDYLRNEVGSSPIDFAKEFYVRYPKVAFGHFPPAFYAIQAGWYLVFGVSKASAILLIGLITAIITSIIFQRTLRLCGTLEAFIGSGLFLSLPLVRIHTSHVMADMLVSLFCILAVTAFADLLKYKHWKYSVYFVVWTILGTLTKGNAFALILFIFLAPFFTGFCGPRHWKRIALLLAATILVTTPFFMVADSLGLSFHTNAYRLARGALYSWQRLHLLEQLYRATGPCLWIVAAAGIIRYAYRWHGRSEEETHRRIDIGCSIAWVLSVVLFQILCYITGESRYFLPALPALIVIFGYGLNDIRQKLSPYGKFVEYGTVAIIVPLAIITVDPDPRKAHSGYAAVAESIPSEHNAPVILIASDERGEGSFIVERLLRDKDRKGVVLRASKTLSKSNWMGNYLKLIFKTSTEVKSYLNSTQVDYIVIDIAAYDDEEISPDVKLLLDTVQNDPANFELRDSFTITRKGTPQVDGLFVYKNLKTDNTKPRVIRLDSGPEVLKDFELILD